MSISESVLPKKVWDVDALKCPKCGGYMKVISFIESPVHIYRQRSLTGCFSGSMVSFRDHPGTTSFWHAGFRQESEVLRWRNLFLRIMRGWKIQSSDR
jgi:hypothetical protein